MQLLLARTAVLVMLLSSFSSAYAEDWKGEPEATQGSFGVLTGLGVFEGTAGYSLLGTVSKKVISHGFVPDIDDSVSIEAEAGPLFVASSTAFQYGLHLRWDFVKDDQWTVYGIGGLGGDITGQSLGNKFELFPRFGAGALWRVMVPMALRFEISHELIAVGVLFPF